MYEQVENLREEFAKIRGGGSSERCFFSERRNNRCQVDANQVIFVSLSSLSTLQEKFNLLFFFLGCLEMARADNSLLLGFAWRKKRRKL